MLQAGDPSDFGTLRTWPNATYAVIGHRILCIQFAQDHCPRRRQISLFLCIQIISNIRNCTVSRHHRLCSWQHSHPKTVATITYNNFSISANGGRGKGTFYELYGSINLAGGMIAEACGVSRIIDAMKSRLLQTPTQRNSEQWDALETAKVL
jgi:hypothetical protein